MTKPQIKEYNCETGIETVRDATDAEMEQIEKDKLSDLAYKTAVKAKAEAKAAAEGKLAALGLTTNDLRALGL
jgi:hypothetical protein